MRFSTRRRRLLLAFAWLVLVPGTIAWAGVPRLVAARGWSPLVALAGRGEPGLAVDRLRNVLATLHAAVTGLDVDEPTAGFFAALREGLASFDLASLHEALPLRDGAWHAVRVVGRRDGGSYRLRQAAAGQPCCVDPTGPLGRELGDAAFELRTRPITRQDGGENYVAALRLGLGVGRMGFSELTAGLAEAMRLAASGDPSSPTCVRDLDRRPAPDTRGEVITMYPRLRPEDVEVIAVLWEAFPELSRVLRSIGRIDDVVVFDPTGNAAHQQLRLAASLCPDLMEERYPALSEFLSELGPLAWVQLEWIDEEERRWGRVVLDTAHLSVTIDAFVRDGQLLPVRNGVVLLDQPLDPALEGARRFTAQVEVRSNLNGIETAMRGLRVEHAFTRAGDDVELAGRITRVPQVSVTGNAFGFVPTWAIDVLIPGNMDELVREFLATACEGNGGRGIRFAVRSRRAPGADAPATVEVEGELEALNSLLVRIGFQIASDKLIPSEEVRAEIAELLLRGHDAFQADLEAFAARSM